MYAAAELPKGKVCMTEKIYSEEELERFREFMETKADRKLLVYHGDADGACSAAMFLRHYKGFEYFPRKGPIMGDDFVRVVLDKKPRLLVFLDLPVDQESKNLERFLEKVPDMKIVILDHHIAEKDVNSERVLHMNPRFHRHDAYIPEACVVYRMLEGLGKDVRSMVWIAAMGTIGDYGLQDCNDLLEETREEYPFLMEGDNPRKNKLGYGAEIIVAAATLKGLHGVGQCLKALMASEGFEDFEDTGKLKAWKAELDEEYDTVMHGFEEEKQEYPEGLVVFEIKSALSITSMIATDLGTRLHDKVVMVRKKSGNQWKVSMRNQSGEVNLGAVVKEAVKGIGSGGGHEKAAAGIVSDWELFLERVRKTLKE